MGSGLDVAALGTLEQALEARRVEAFPASGKPPEDARGALWVRPELVVSVRFLGFTEGEVRLRAPVYRGLRRDVSPSDCRAAPASELIEELPAPSAAPPPASPAIVRNAPSKASTRVLVSNPNKLFWPDEGYTKGDLCAYYASIAEVMLPFLHERPVVLVRYPDGIAGKHFYHGTCPPVLRIGFERIEIVDEEEPGSLRKTLFLLDSADALVHIANLGCIPLHVLAAQRGSLDQCDFLTVDFDIADRPFAGRGAFWPWIYESSWTTWAW